jgi:hypothetical protein
VSVAVKRMGYTGAEVAHFLGVTTSGENRAVSKALWSDQGKSLNDEERGSF